MNRFSIQVELTLHERGFPSNIEVFRLEFPVDLDRAKVFIREVMDRAEDLLDHTTGHPDTYEEEVEEEQTTNFNFTGLHPIKGENDIETPPEHPGPLADYPAEEFDKLGEREKLNQPFNISDLEVEEVIERLRGVMGGPNRYGANVYFQEARDRLVRNLTAILWELGAVESDFIRFKNEKLGWARDYCVEPTCVDYLTVVPSRAHRHSEAQRVKGAKRGRPQKNPGMCGTHHVFDHPLYTGDILCRQCGHYQWDDCHHDPFHESVKATEQAERRS